MQITEITAVKQKSDKPIRLAAYCRVSSNSEDQLHSFAAQILSCIHQTGRTTEQLRGTGQALYRANPK